MEERCFSYRKFAKVAGVSPQRLSELIKQGVVRRNGAGQIPESEVNYFIREKLKKGASNARRSHLCIVVGKSQEEFEVLRSEYVASFKENGSYAEEVESIAALVDKLRSGVAGGNIDDVAKLAELRYKKTLLKELVKRMQEAAFRCISKYISVPEIGMYPAISLYELLMYDKLYSGGNEEEMRETLSKRVAGGIAPLALMESSYKSIVVSLGIIDSAGTPLVSRADLSPEAVAEISSMTMNTDVPNDVFIQTFLSLPFNINSNARTRNEGLEAVKIRDDVVASTLSKERAAKIGNIALQGYYTIFNLSGENPKDQLDTLVSDIADGFYSIIDIIGDSEVIQSYIPNSLREAFHSCDRNRCAVVRLNPKK